MGWRWNIRTHIHKYQRKDQKRKKTAVNLAHYNQSDSRENKNILWNEYIRWRNISQEMFSGQKCILIVWLIRWYNHSKRSIKPQWSGAESPFTGLLVVKIHVVTTRSYTINSWPMHTMSVFCERPMLVKAHMRISPRSVAFFKTAAVLSLELTPSQPTATAPWLDQITISFMLMKGLLSKAMSFSNKPI